MDVDAILYGLNDAQRTSVTSTASVLQVLAPPGSGKTKTLTARVAYLIAHWQLKPWNIITCTFTRKAANEMKERIRSFIGEDLSKQIKLGTFHSVAVLYLRRYGHHIGLDKDFGIADSSDSKAILNRIIKRTEFTIQAGQALGRISAQKVKGLTVEDVRSSAKHVEQQEFAQVFASYEAELKASNLLDYDDLLLRCCFLLRTHPQCVSNVDAVLIDEFQDTNTVQYELMSLFAQRRNSITIVGDPDQSIYGFRSAEIKNLSLMKQQWPDTLTINLEENYRSSGAILHAAQNIIEQDESRPPKKLQATHSLGERPVLRKLPSAAAEAAWLVSEIKRMHALSGAMLMHSDFAILLRSAALSRVIESTLSSAGVPYRMVGGTKFYDRAEVKLILDYLRVIEQPRNNEALERIINVPSRRIGDATVKTLRVEASSKHISVWDLVQRAAQGRTIQTKLSPAAQRGISSFVNIILSGQRRKVGLGGEVATVLDLMNLVINKIDLQAYLKQKYESEHEARWSNVEELLAQATDVSDPARLKAMAEEQSLPHIDGIEQQAEDNADALSIFLANVALTASIEERKGEEGQPIPQVTISTIHSAKGLEWPVVFIPACYDGSIPHSRAEDNDEERRLLYVGMTRAQGLLYLSCPVRNTQREETTMSSFLTQPGVTNFFEDHGPTLSFESVYALARTLGREDPSAEAIGRGKRELEKPDDNYWPLNGEDPYEELSKWNYGRSEPTASVGVYMQPKSLLQPAAGVTGPSALGTNAGPAPSSRAAGFVSVKEQYEELMEQGRLKSIDKRAEARSTKDNNDGPRGRKRQIEGQSTLAGFLSKRQKASPESYPTSKHAEPLREITNFNNAREPSIIPHKTKEELSQPSHKPRTAPFRQCPPAVSAADAGHSYVFLSSSPTRAEEHEQTTQQEPAEESTSLSSASALKTLQSGFQSVRPAVTLHTTSIQALQHPQRKSYGVKPSFNGWANRARK